MLLIDAIKILVQVVLVCGLFIACTQPILEDSSLILPTTKDNVISQYQLVDWSQEIEPSGLSDPVIHTDGFSLPSSLAAQHSAKNIYPFYRNFGSLDSSEYPPALLSRVFEFLKVATLEEPDKRSLQTQTSFMDPKSEFLPVVLEYNFKRLHKISFCYLGQPQITDSVYAVPVRLKGNTEYTDLMMFIKKHDENFYIEQIQFKETIDE